MSDTARPYPERQPGERLENVLLEGMALVVADAYRAIFRPLIDRVARHRTEQAALARWEAEREAERVRNLDPIEFIRDTAARELAAGKAQIRRDFDRLYADLGIARQEPRP